MQTSRLVLALCLAPMLSACAGFEFYSNKDLTAKAGIPLYKPKPYLLVSRTGAKDKPVEISVVYISDQNDIIYAKPRSGFGSSKLSLSLSNGQLTAFGQETDTKVPELIDSLSGLITARAGAGKTDAETKQILDTLQATKPATEVAADAKRVSDDIAARVANGCKQLKGLTRTECDTVTRTGLTIGTVSTVLSNPANVTQLPEQLKTLKQAAKDLSEISVASTPPVSPRDQSLALIHGWQNDLEKLVAASEPDESDKPEKPAFELYEIVQSGSGVSLRRVPVAPQVTLVVKPEAQQQQ